MDVEKEIRAMRCRKIRPEVNEFYPAVMEELRSRGSDCYCDEFTAMTFYDIGIAHGIRQERQRRHEREQAKKERDEYWRSVSEIIAELSGLTPDHREKWERKCSEMLPERKSILRKMKTAADELAAERA